MWTYTRIVWWALFWWFIQLIWWPFRRGRDNCMTWAVRQFEREGGYLVMRWTTGNRCRCKNPHILWIPRAPALLFHLVPNRDERCFPVPWFHGKVQVGDFEYTGNPVEGDDDGI